MSGSTRRVTPTLFLAVLGFAVQQTAVVPAIQDVQTSLHASSEWAAWLVTVDRPARVGSRAGRTGSASRLTSSERRRRLLARATS